HWLMEELESAGISYLAQVKVAQSEDPLISIFKLLVEGAMDSREPDVDLLSFFVDGHFAHLGFRNSIDRKLIAQFIEGIKQIGLKASFQRLMFAIGLSNSNYSNNCKIIENICDMHGDSLSSVYRSLAKGSD